MVKPLPPNQQLISGPKWPLVGEQSPRKDDGPWEVAISGCVDHERTISQRELESMPQVARAIDVHCVTRWSKRALRFSGVPLLTLLGYPNAPCWNASANFISFGARSDRNHSSSLPLEEVIRLDPLVALCADGRPLEASHGGPIRMVVPNKYFYKSVKWLAAIEFLETDRLGYWEAEAGYHNGADPWREQRYLATTLSKQEVSVLIASRDFRGRHLRSIAAADRDLSGLRAAGAQLRNGDFRRCNLAKADFRQANLSNAHFQAAILQDVSFEQADLEGANFNGANLRGANLRGASLVGASFCDLGADNQLVQCALLDTDTRIDADAIETLTEVQQAFLRQSYRCD